MVWYTFGPFSAYDPTQDGAAKASTFTVYGENDTANSTPLVTQNLQGLAVPVTSDSDGVVAAFRVENQPAIKIVSGSYSIPAYSVKDMRDATLAAQVSAATSATQAANTAASVAALDSWVKLGVTRYNQCLDPRATNPDRWYSAGGSGGVMTETMAVSATDGPVLPDGSRASTYARYTFTSAVSSGNSWFGYRADTPASNGYANGAKAAVAIYIRTSRAATARSYSYGTTAAGSSVDLTFGSNVALSANTWVRLSNIHTVVTDHGAYSVFGHFTGTLFQAGDIVEVTCALINPGAATVPDHFDGAMKATDLKGYNWQGSANASVSQMIDYTVITNAATAQAQAAQDAAEDAQTAAEAAQSSAASLASGVVRKVNGVAPDSSGNVTVSGGGSGSAVTSVAGKTGDVSLVKGDVGLGQVDNTSDANKPVSTAQAAALAGKANASHTHAVADVSGLQAALDSKAGLNAAVNASQINAGTGVIAPARLGTGTSITTKFLRGDGTWQTVSTGGGGTGAVDSVNGQTGDVVLDAADVGALPDTYTAPVTSVAGLTGAVTLNKTNVGLANVDNTADTAKPISTLQQAALDAKAADSAVVKLTGNQTVAGTKTFSAAPVVPDASFTQAKVSGLVSALAGKVASSTVTDIVVLTAAAYNALPTPRSSSTLYIKVG